MASKEWEYSGAWNGHEIHLTLRIDGDADEFVNAGWWHELIGVVADTVDTALESLAAMSEDDDEEEYYDDEDEDYYEEDEDEEEDDGGIWEV